ncbi:MAG: phosphoenolpyruvate synthase [Chlamydiota bacterium]
MADWIRTFDSISLTDIPIVGGKNASLGEMIRTLQSKHIHVPDGFATTASAYQHFFTENHLYEKISSLLQKYQKGHISLQKAGKKIREYILKGNFSKPFYEEILRAYKDLSKKYNTYPLDVAVRSSATAEDLPDASFAGQQESYLHIQGEKELLTACKKCFASLFTDRAISYREAKGFDHMKVSLSVGVQKMVRSDKGGSGVMFTIDTETGFPNVILISAAFGLGENVVQGTINPDEYLVFKPFLHKKNIIPIIEKKLGTKQKKLIYSSGKNKTKNIPATSKEQKSFVLQDDEIIQLASWGKLIEDEYKKPMDIEWAKDGLTQTLFIVQARSETVESKKMKTALSSFSLKEVGKKILEGSAIGESIACGKVQIIKNVKDIESFQEGSILVTEMTSPDWVPIMKKAKGIITNKGGRTSHAAIVSRELGVPAIVGSEKATKILKKGQKITLSCAEGDKGFVYEGFLEYEEKEINAADLPKTSTPIMMNISSPMSAFRWWQLPTKGIGLARMEFIIQNIIKIHPMALTHFHKVHDLATRKIIEKITEGYKKKEEYFIDTLSQSIAKIAASQYPNPAIVRMSDFKTNEYANLIGGSFFEFTEENPMLGFRGASRYYSSRYRDGFALECLAMKKARDEMGFTNIILMIPFCRTPEEADKVLHILEKNGLKRGKNGLEVYVMCEIPSNIILADEFADRFDGFSIGSNDLTQLILGVDRDSEELSYLFDARNDAVKKMISQVIQAAHKKNRKVGICGQAPSDYPDFAEFLVQEGIDSISLNPDSVIEIIPKIAAIEKTLRKKT